MMMLRRFPRAAAFPVLHREMSRLFDSVAAELPRARGGEKGSEWVPAVDTVETPEALVVRLELPGIDPATIDISVEDGVLDVSARREEERPQERSGWTRYERVTGAFRRRLELPMPVEVDRIEAESRHGVLTVTLPKKAESLPRKISVRSRP